jgi:hypothetical protein
MRLAFPLAALIVVGTAGAAAAAPTQGDAAAGEALFVGRTQMRNRGPSCASCHNAAGLPFPYGGSMGPDLTDEYSKLGPDGLRYALATLYFPAMTALFIHHPLAPEEQADLAAFFRSIDHRRPIATALGPLVIASVAGLAALLLLTGLYGRNRVRSVRRALLARVARERQR